MFSECRDDSQVVCNSTGDDYGLIPCEHGCAAPTGCLGISCTPNAFSTCQGNDALSCNATGDNFTLESCAHGCDPTFGCLTCEPNEVACTNGTLSTCNAAGTAMTSTACGLGCAPVGARCRELVPSNNLKQYLDLVPNPPDLALANATFHTDDGVVTVAGQPVSVPSTLVPASPPHPAIRVFLVNSLTLSNGSVTATGNGTSPGPAAAIVGRGDITIDGQLVVGVLVGSGDNGCTSPGRAIRSMMAPYDASGAGGGGNATTGGAGGEALDLLGGLGGPVQGTATVVPLRGGCKGGGDPTTPNGGGALQLATSGRITIAGSVVVRGGTGDGLPPENPPRPGGGGAGGNVLLEAASIDIAAGGAIDVRGGTGFQACATPSNACGAGGVGATAATPAGDGGNAVSGVSLRGGGGGGGLGRLRVNTLSATYSTAPGAVVNASVTTGTIAID